MQGIRKDEGDRRRTNLDLQAWRELQSGQRNHSFSKCLEGTGIFGNQKWPIVDRAVVYSQATADRWVVLGKHAHEKVRYTDVWSRANN